jgi:site-specific DNA-cytosine methylase
MSRLYNFKEGIGQTTQKDPKVLKTLKESKEKQKERNENKLAKGTMPARNKKNFRPTKSGAGMTRAGVKAYRRLNPGSKLKTAVTGKVKPGSKAAKRRKSFCARSLGQMKKFPKAAKDPNSRLRQARRRWKC